MMQDVEIPGDKAEGYAEEEIYSENELVNEEEEANMETASYAIVKMKGHLALILSIVQSISTVYCVRHIPPTLCIGYEKTVQIVAQVCPPSEDQGEDVLIFKESTNGVFYVKKAYIRLMDCGAILSQGEKALWDRVWRAGAIQPCVRLHVWKLIHGVLPLGQILHSRIGMGARLVPHVGKGMKMSAICCSDALLLEHVVSWTFAFAIRSITP